MKKSLIAMTLAAACVLTAAEKKDYSQYLKVATDLGTGKATWTMTSSYASPTIKKLNLEVDPAEVKAAAIEYEINCHPYDPVTKTYVSKEDHALGRETGGQGKQCLTKSSSWAAWVRILSFDTCRTTSR